VQQPVNLKDRLDYKGDEATNRGVKD